MSKQNVLSACALFCVFGAAGAEPIVQSGSGNLPSIPQYGFKYLASWESSSGTFQFAPSVTGAQTGGFTLTGQFTTTTPVLDVNAFDFRATVQFQIVRLATGLPELPAYLLAPPTGLSRPIHTGSAAAVYDAVGQPNSIRFSNAIEETTLSLTNGDGQSLLTTTNGLASNAIVNFALTERYVPGNFLAPSPDPSCASFDCMVPGRDTLRIAQAGSFSFTASVVPEPASIALMLAGLVAVAAAVRRGGGAATRHSNRLNPP